LKMIRYHIPGDGDDAEHPNIFRLPGKIPPQGVQLKHIIKAFPVPGEYNFRFKAYVRSKLVWMDVFDADAVVPTIDGQVVMKVARVRHDPRVAKLLNAQPAPASTAQRAPQVNATNGGRGSSARSLAFSSSAPTLATSATIPGADVANRDPRLRRPSVVYDGSGNATGFADDGSVAMPPPPMPNPPAAPAPSGAGGAAGGDTADLLGGFGEVASPGGSSPPTSGIGSESDMGDLLGGFGDSGEGGPNSSQSGSSGSNGDLMGDPFSPGGGGMGFGQPMHSNQQQQQQQQAQQQQGTFGGMSAFNAMQQQKNQQQFQG